MKIKSDQKLSFVPVCELDTFPNCRSWIWWKKFGKKRVQLRLQQAFWTKVAVTIQDITQTLTPPSWCRETLRSSPKAPDTTFYPDQVSQTFLSFFYFPLIQWSIQYPNLFGRLSRNRKEAWVNGNGPFLLLSFIFSPFLSFPIWCYKSVM